MEYGTMRFRWRIDKIRDPTDEHPNPRWTDTGLRVTTDNGSGSKALALAWEKHGKRMHELARQGWYMEVDRI